MELDDAVIKFWLLDIATEFPRSLGMLFPSVESEALNVKEIPNCKQGDYAASLIELFEAGLITLESDFSEDDVNSKFGVSRIIERFEHLSKDERQLRYVRSGPHAAGVRLPLQCVRFQLTRAGGQEWEKYAEPDWDHCFDQSTGNEEGEIFSQNRDLVMAVLGWFQEIEGGRVHLESIALQEIKDYPIFYWKNLPYVYKATFTFERAEARWSGNGPAWLNAPKWFKEWWAAATSSWYRKPWELPGWPSE
jgi:hypothetical protein